MMYDGKSMAVVRARLPAASGHCAPPAAAARRLLSLAAQRDAMQQQQAHWLRVEVRADAAAAARDAGAGVDRARLDGAAVDASCHLQYGPASRSFACAAAAAVHDGVDGSSNDIILLLPRLQPF